MILVLSKIKGDYMLKNIDKKTLREKIINDDYVLKSVGKKCVREKIINDDYNMIEIQ